MIFVSFLNLEFINKIVQDFVQVIGLVVVVVNIYGEEIFDFFNFMLFCQLMCQDLVNYFCC